MVKDQCQKSPLIWWCHFFRTFLSVKFHWGWMKLLPKTTHSLQFQTVTKRQQSWSQCATALVDLCRKTDWRYCIDVLLFIWGNSWRHCTDVLTFVHVRKQWYTQVLPSPGEPFSCSRRIKTHKQQQEKVSTVTGFSMSDKVCVSLQVCSCGRLSLTPCQSEPLPTPTTTSTSCLAQMTPKYM